MFKNGKFSVNNVLIISVRIKRPGKMSNGHLIIILLLFFEANANKGVLTTYSIATSFALVCVLLPQRIIINRHVTTHFVLIFSQLLVEK